MSAARVRRKLAVSETITVTFQVTHEERIMLKDLLMDALWRAKRRSDAAKTFRTRDKYNDWAGLTISVNRALWKNKYDSDWEVSGGG